MFFQILKTKYKCIHLYKMLAKIEHSLAWSLEQD